MCRDCSDVDNTFTLATGNLCPIIWIGGIWQIFMLQEFIDNRTNEI